MRVSYGHQHPQHKLLYTCADGRPTGAVRVSYSYMSNMGDAEAVLSLVCDFFVEGGGLPAATLQPAAADAAHPAAAAGAQPAAGLRPAGDAAASALQATETSHPEAGAATATPPASNGFAPSVQAPTGGNATGVPALGAAAVAASPPPLPKPRPPHPLGQTLPPPPDTPPALSPRPPMGRPQASGSGVSSLDTAEAPPGSLSAGGAAGSKAAGAAALFPSQQRSSGAARLAGMWVYPIKSAAAIAAAAWPLGPNGLLLDREWAVVNPNGGALRRAQHPRLAAIQPRISFDAGESVFLAQLFPGTLHS